MIPIAKTALGPEELKAVERVIHSGWLTQGPEVAAFEKEFAQCVGAKYAAAVSNCTTALHLALLAAGVSPGDEVLTVSHSFIATANSIRHCGATPVFVDIEPKTFNMNVDLIERHMTSKTRAILCVHQIGMPCDVKSIVTIAKKHGLPVIEDAACAVGSEILGDSGWEKIGKPHGDVACFSFHPRKILTTGDGGMITTNRPEWDQKFRLLRQHGMSVSDAVRHNSKEVIFETYPIVGYNYRMTDLQAAIGREQLKKLPEIVKTRRQFAGYYFDRLKNVEELSLPHEPQNCRSNWQSYSVLLRDGLPQKQIMQDLLDHGIATRRGVMCAHLEDAYRGMNLSLPVSERVQNQSIILPLFSQMTEKDFDFIADHLVQAIRKAKG